MCLACTIATLAFGVTICGVEPRVQDRNDNDVRVVAVRNHTLTSGRLLSSGDFVPNVIPDSKPRLLSVPIVLYRESIYAPTFASVQARELRTLAVVNGSFYSQHPSMFVPDIGRRVEAYNPGRPEHRGHIYNQPVRRALVDSRPPETPFAVPSPPNGWKLRLYHAPGLAVHDRVRYISKVAELGRLDEFGEFVPTLKRTAFAVLDQNDRGVIADACRADGGGEPVWYTLPTPPNDFEDVYEYRSGRLIRGRLVGPHGFQPEVGSTVIAFRDFDPVNDKRRIYNLPGVLVRDDKPADKK